MVFSLLLLAGAAQRFPKMYLAMLLNFSSSHLFLSLHLFCQNAICAGVGRAPAFAWALAVSLPSPSQAILI